MSLVSKKMPTHASYNYSMIYFFQIILITVDYFCISICTRRNFDGTKKILIAFFFCILDTILDHSLKFCSYLIVV